MQRPKPYTPKKRLWGFDVRQPYPPEQAFLHRHPNLGAFMGKDNQIVLNPNSNLSEFERHVAARAEAARHYLKQQGAAFEFDLTPDQIAFYQGSPYEQDDAGMRTDLICRIVASDPSAVGNTREQVGAAASVLSNLIQRR